MAVRSGDARTVDITKSVRIGLSLTAHFLLRLRQVCVTPYAPQLHNDILYLISVSQSRGIVA
jgi:hypothetical protein